MDNNNNEKKTVNKRAYIAAIICIAAAIIAIVAISLAVGLTRDSSTPEPSGGDPTITIPAPDDNEEPEEPDEPEEPEEPDEPTVSTPTYALPLSECVVGNACSLDELVWSDTLHWYSTHNGTDFVAEEGTPVLAASDGTVTYVGYSTQDGYTVTVEQTDGYTAVYKSLSADTVAETGNTIAAGDVLGYVSDSMTSEQNSGPHLHLEMINADGVLVDPMTLLGNATEK